MNLKTLLSIIVALILSPALTQAQSNDNSGSGSDIERLGQTVVIENPQASELSQIVTLKGIDPDYYKLGPYDVLSLSVDGLYSLIAKSLVVDAQGIVHIPTIGSLSVEGLTINEAREQLNSLITDKYNNTQIDFFSLIKARNIIVTVGGDIAQNEPLKLSGLTRLYDVVSYLTNTEDSDSRPNTNLSSEGSSFENFSVSTQRFRKSNQDGASADANFSQKNRPYSGISEFDLRSVTVKRANGGKLKYDLQRYIYSGDSDQNPVLNSGDHVILKKRSPADPTISVSGEVFQPGEFEYRDDDDLEVLLKLTAGLTSKADSLNIQMYSEGQWNTITFDELSAKTKFAPNTHIIFTSRASSDIKSSTWISGEVRYQGNYPVQNGETTLNDLIEMSGGYTQSALPNGAYIERQVSTNGQSQYDLKVLKRSSDQVVEGLEYLNLETDVTTQRFFVDPTKHGDDFVVQQGDHVVIPYNTNSIMVFGQVNNPGRFTFNPNYNVDDYIKMAGGTALAANSNRIFVIKAGSKSWVKPKNTEIESGDTIYIDRKPYIDYANQQQLESADKQLLLQQISVIISAVSTSLLLLNYLK